MTRTRQNKSTNLSWKKVSNYISSWSKSSKYCIITNCTAKDGLISSFKYLILAPGSKPIINEQLFRQLREKYGIFHVEYPAEDAFFVNSLPPEVEQRLRRSAIIKYEYREIKPKLRHSTKATSCHVYILDNGILVTWSGINIQGRQHISLPLLFSTNIVDADHSTALISNDSNCD